jgi:hypothetical protein
MPETLVAEWILAGATVGLMTATAVLAWATWNLFKATRQLASIETGRETRTRLEQRRAKLAKKIELGGKVAALHPGWKEEILPFMRQGVLRPELETIAELAPLLEYDHDQVIKEDVDMIVLAVDNLRRMTQYSSPGAEKFMEVLERAKDRISYDVPKWRRELTAVEIKLATQ